MVSRKIRAQAKAERAQYVYARAGWGKQKKRWLYLYRLYGPEGKPFFPSDEALQTLVATLPDIRFKRSERKVDRDIFLVYGKKFNLFTTRASPELKQMRAAFLQQLGAMATEERQIGQEAKEAAELFLSEGGFVAFEWNGNQIIALSAERHRYEGRLMREGNIGRLFRKFQRIYRHELPFSYGAAPT